MSLRRVELGPVLDFGARADASPLPTGIGNRAHLVIAEPPAPAPPAQAERWRSVEEAPDTEVSNRRSAWGDPSPIDGDDSARVFLRHLERVVYETLFSETPYSHFFRDVAVVIEKRVIQLFGRVPSYYLKSVLQSRLQHALPSFEVENRVRVVSATGLSSAWDSPEEEHASRQVG